MSAKILAEAMVLLELHFLSLPVYKAATAILTKQVYRCIESSPVRGKFAISKNAEHAAGLLTWLIIFLSVLLLFCCSRCGGSNQLPLQLLVSSHCSCFLRFCDTQSLMPETILGTCL